LALEHGTGRFVGIGGEGDLVVRSVLPEFTERAAPSAAPGAAIIRESASVLLVLPALRYRIP
jgi:hypothetical protein